MIEFVGFSMEKIFPFCIQYMAISAQNSVITFPFWTLTVSVRDILVGNPAGNSVDLSGFGFGMFGHLSSFHCGIGISRALVYVPHGGQGERKGRGLVSRVGVRIIVPFRSLGLP